MVGQCQEGGDHDAPTWREKHPAPTRAPPSHMMQAGLAGMIGMAGMAGMAGIADSFTRT